MATVYSGEVAVGTYNRIRIQCDYSGTTANLTVQFRRTISRNDRWSDPNATLTFNGQSKGAAYSYSGTVGTNWINLVTVNGYTISSSGGTYNWQFNNPTGGILGCSGDIVIPAQGSKPSNGHIDNLRSVYNSENGLIEFTADSVGVTSSLALSRFSFNISSVPYTSGITSPHQYIYCTNDSPVILNQSNSTAAYGGLTFIGNSLYYSGLYASNTIGDYTFTGQSIVSPCEPASFLIEKASNSSATVTYTTVADGGAYDKQIEYSLDGGVNWAVGAIVSSSSATTGTFTISSLNLYSVYAISIRIRTPAGSTNCGTINFSLVQPKFYGSVNDLTEKVNAFYGSLNSQTKKIIKYYASENGRAKLIYKEKS